MECCDDRLNSPPAIGTVDEVTRDGRKSRPFWLLLPPRRRKDDLADAVERVSTVNDQNRLSVLTQTEELPQLAGIVDRSLREGPRTEHALAVDHYFVEAMRG